MQKNKKKRPRFHNKAQKRKEASETTTVESKRARTSPTRPAQPSTSSGISPRAASSSALAAPPRIQMPWICVPLAEHVCITSMAAIAQARHDPRLRQYFVGGRVPSASSEGNQPVDVTRQRTLLQYSYEQLEKSLHAWLANPVCMSVIRLLKGQHIQACSAHPAYLVEPGYY